MARVKLAGKRKPASVETEFQKYRGAIPCLFVIISVMALLFVVLYYSMQSAGR